MGAARAGSVPTSGQLNTERRGGQTEAPARWSRFREATVARPGHASDSPTRARPVTRLSFSPEIGEWTPADFRDGGVSSDVCTPFMWSLYEEALSVSLPEYFKRLRLIPRDHEATWARMFFGRPYWNLGEVKAALEKLPGYDEAAFHADMGVEVDPDFVPSRTPTRSAGSSPRCPPSSPSRGSTGSSSPPTGRSRTDFRARTRPYDLRPEAVAALDHDTLSPALPRADLPARAHGGSRTLPRPR